MEKHYKASLSRSQGRSSWAVIFPHPVRRHRATGKEVRVRHGLGTDSEVEASDLVAKLNALLADKSYWGISARSDAVREFGLRVAEIFYYGMEPEGYDFNDVRNSFIEMPTSRDSDYRSALLLGTTGAGKTTLLTQLIGADPRTERFLSMSTAKTTVHETEIILDEGDYRVAATFFPMEEVREHLEECISEAVLSAYRSSPDSELLRKLLMHVNQRFRFKYILGNGPQLPSADAEELDEDDDDVTDIEQLPLVGTDLNRSAIDLNATNALLASVIAEVRGLALRHGDQMRAALGDVAEEDQRVVEELCEENLDRALREDETFHSLSDTLMDEMALRFAILEEIEPIQRNSQDWPVAWFWSTGDRSAFVGAVTRIAGNQSPLFGQLLTPVVNGVRLAGPFIPKWNDGRQPKLVLLDGEGLGHTPRSSAAITSSVMRRIEAADAIVLVDNATGPMQAAPVSAIRETITSGAIGKLLIVFTHFDQIKGDNLADDAARREHVLASAENVLSLMGEDLGPFAERAFRTRLNTACFFIGGLDRPFQENLKSHRRSIAQLKDLLAQIDAIVEKPTPVESKPIYNRMNLALAVTKVAEGFRDSWRPRLGLSSKVGVSKEQWKRVWALSKRLSNPTLEDGYDTLQPVADLRQQLKARLYVLLQNPESWSPSEPVEDDEKQQVFDRIADGLSARLRDLAARRIRTDRLDDWQAAFRQSGPGSSFSRARIIGGQIYDRATPIPDVVPSPDQNSFLREVANVVGSVCAENGAELR